MWLLPTRRRPANLARFFDAYRATGGSTPGMVLIDGGDWLVNSGAYRAIDLPLGWTLRVTGGETQGEKLAEVWDDVKHCSWLGLVGDDCVPETQGWDRRMVNAIDGANIISCDDGWQAPNRIANCWIMAGDLVRAVGYIFASGMQHLYVDDMWEAIGRDSGCWRVLMDVRVAHRHVLKLEAAADETHKRVYGTGTQQDGLWPADRAAFQSWLDNERARIARAVAALRQGMAGPEEAARARELEAQLKARVKTRSVLIGTPSHGDIKHQYVDSLLLTWDYLKNRGIERNRICLTKCSRLPAARNYICAWFLASNYTDLIFIDDDMGWPEKCVMDLLVSPHPVIGAVGRRKDDKVSWCYRPLPGAESGIYLDELGNMQVQCVGTGILKISREALEKIASERPDLKLPGVEDMPPNVAEKHHNFFYYGPLQEGEDYMFCDLWRSVGGEVWVMPNVEVTHVGTKEYVGNLGHQIVPVPEAANDNAPQKIAA